MARFPCRRLFPPRCRGYRDNSGRCGSPHRPLFMPKAGPARQGWRSPRGITGRCTRSGAAALIRVDHKWRHLAVMCAAWWCGRRPQGLIGTMDRVLIMVPGSHCPKTFAGSRPRTPVMTRGTTWPNAGTPVTRPPKLDFPPVHLDMRRQAHGRPMAVPRVST
jgi:hypothetical protein